MIKEVPTSIPTPIVDIKRNLLGDSVNTSGSMPAAKEAIAMTVLISNSGNSPCVIVFSEGEDLLQSRWILVIRSFVI